MPNKKLIQDSIKKVGEMKAQKIERPEGSKAKDDATKAAELNAKMKLRKKTGTIR